MRICSYIRVSTDAQQRSGLGLEAQRIAIKAYAHSIGAEVVSEFVETESGKRNDRPELTKALRHARITNSRLAIARLDRLGRNAAFLLTLRDSGVDFVACDDPVTTPLTVGVKAILAEEEARVISERTKAALAAAKARGQRLGNPNGARALRRAGKGNAASHVAQKANANAFATDLAEVLEDVTASGHSTLPSQAAELNRRGIRTARGGRWHASSVSNLRNRLASLTPADAGTPQSVNFTR